MSKEVKKLIAKGLLLLIMVISASFILKSVKVLGAELPQEPVYQKYELEMNEPDGEGNYYRSIPEIQICHLQEGLKTRYRLSQGEELLAEGMLSLPGEQQSLEKEYFVQGKQSLEIWMEDANGQPLEEFREKYLLQIDSKDPKLTISAPRGFLIWHPDQVNIRVSAKDEESDIESVSCYVNGKKLRESSQKDFQFSLSEASEKGNAVKLRVRAKDHAGNKSEVEKSLYIDRKAPVLTLSGAQDYQISKKAVTLQFQAEEENQLDQISASIIRKSPSGKKESMQLDGLAFESFQRVEKSLSKDGFYSISFQASDKAGHQQSLKLHLTIDRHKPKLRHIREWDQRLLKSFCWNYSAKDLVSDFTSYISELYLDGKPFRKGNQIFAEGRHKLSLKAVDAAGNQSKEEAVFWIDHTKPKLLISGVEDGKSYDRQLEILLRLEKREDFLRSICLNGKELLETSGLSEKRLKLTAEGNYELLVSARDAAGNEMTEKVYFSIQKKKAQDSQLMKKSKGKQGNTEESEEKLQTEEKQSLLPLIAMGAIFFLLLLGAIKLWRK